MKLLLQCTYSLRNEFSLKAFKQQSFLPYESMQELFNSYYEYKIEHLAMSISDMAISFFL